jgi:4-hydroxyphenylpyruvate dioxygenase-like putative hemolysin
MSKLNYTVTKEDTTRFAQVWDLNGIKVILDSTTVQFATDYANQVLKSFVADMAAQVKKVAEAKIAAQKAGPDGGTTVTPSDAVSTQTVSAPVTSKSAIILTD